MKNSLVDLYKARIPELVKSIPQQKLRTYLAKFVTLEAIAFAAASNVVCKFTPNANELYLCRTGTGKLSVPLDSGLDGIPVMVGWNPVIGKQIKNLHLVSPCELSEFEVSKKQLLCETFSISSDGIITCGDPEIYTEAGAVACGTFNQNTIIPHFVDGDLSTEIDHYIFDGFTYDEDNILSNTGDLDYQYRNGWTVAFGTSFSDYQSGTYLPLTKFLSLLPEDPTDNPVNLDQNHVDVLRAMRETSLAGGLVSMIEYAAKTSDDNIKIHVLANDASGTLVRYIDFDIAHNVLISLSPDDLTDSDSIGMLLALPPGGFTRFQNTLVNDRRIATYDENGVLSSIRFPWHSVIKERSIHDIRFVREEKRGPTLNTEESIKRIYRGILAPEEISVTLVCSRLVNPYAVGGVNIYSCSCEDCGTLPNFEFRKDPTADIITEMNVRLPKTFLSYIDDDIDGTWDSVRLFAGRGLGLESASDIVISDVDQNGVPATISMNNCQITSMYVDLDPLLSHKKETEEANYCLRYESSGDIALKWAGDIAAVTAVVVAGAFTGGSGWAFFGILTVGGATVATTNILYEREASWPESD